MLKKLLAAGLLTVAFTAAPLFDAEVMPTAIAAPSNVTMENYPALTGKTQMAQMTSKDMSKIKTTIKNQYLVELLEEKGQNTAEISADIKNHDGSVQHLDFLTEHEKNVFKTFAELNQYEIINQASIRQRFIDQAQSLNIMINPAMMTTKEINQLHLYAWENGIKSLYYQHSTSAALEF